MNRTIFEEVEKDYQRIKERGKSDQVRRKLAQVHATLGNLASKGVKPGIATLVKHLNQEGMKISERMFYNKREDGNLYRELFNAWNSHWDTQDPKIVATSPTAIQGASIIEDSDLEKIKDHVLRYRVSILLGELKGLRQQVNILRHAAGNHTVTPRADKLLQGHDAQKLILNEYEFELIEDLSDGSSDLDFGDDGELVAKGSIKRSTVLSKPGLKDALSKVLKSYELPQFAGKNLEDMGVSE